MEQPRSEKWNKQMYIFLKRGVGVSFGAVQVEKVESLGAADAEKWGLSGGTYPYCPKVGVLPAPSRWGYPPRARITTKMSCFELFLGTKEYFSACAVKKIEDLVNELCSARF